MALIDVDTYPVPHDKGNGSGGGKTYIMGGGKSSTYNSLNVQSINASKGNIDYLNTKSISANDASIMYLMTREGQIIRLSGNELKYNSGYIGALYSDTIETNKLKTTDLEALNAFIDTLQSREITTEYLTVTKQAHFFELVIDKIRAVGGIIILTPASCIIDYVLAHKTGYGTSISAYEIPVTANYDNYDYFRVYWRATDNFGRSVSNDFVENDQVICQSFNNVTTGVNYNVSDKYYWRLVDNVYTSRVYVNFSTGAISETDQNTEVNEFEVIMMNTQTKKLDSDTYYQNNINWTANEQSFKDKDGNEIFGIETNVSWTDGTKGTNEAVHGTFRTASQVYGIEIKPNGNTITNKIQFYIKQKSVNNSYIIPKSINIGIYFTDDSFKVYNAVSLNESTGEYNINLDDIDAPIESIVIVSTADVDWHLCNYMDISNNYIASANNAHIAASDSGCDYVVSPAVSIPEAGDNLVQLGNRGNEETGFNGTNRRQNAIIIAAYNGPDSELVAPYYAQYQGIRTFALSPCRKTYFDAKGANFVGNFKLTNGHTIQEEMDYVAQQRYNANAYKNNKIYADNTDNVIIRIDRTKQPSDSGYYIFDPENLNWKIKVYNTSDGTSSIQTIIPSNFAVNITGYYQNGSKLNGTISWGPSVELGTGISGSSSSRYNVESILTQLLALDNDPTKNIGDFNNITVELLYANNIGQVNGVYQGTVIDRNKIGITVIPLAIDGATGPAGPEGPAGRDGVTTNKEFDKEELIAKILTTSNVNLYCNIQFRVNNGSQYEYNEQSWTSYMRLVDYPSATVSSTLAAQPIGRIRIYAINRNGDAIEIGSNSGESGVYTIPCTINTTSNTGDLPYTVATLQSNNLLSIINPSNNFPDSKYRDYQLCAETYPERCPVYLQISVDRYHWVYEDGSFSNSYWETSYNDKIVNVVFETGVLFEKLDDRIVSKIGEAMTGEIDLSSYATKTWCNTNFSTAQQTATGFNLGVNGQWTVNVLGANQLYDRTTIDRKFSEINITAEQIESVIGDDYYNKNEVDSAINNAIGDPNYFSQVLDLYTDSDFSNDSYYPVTVNVGSATNVSENGPMITCQVDCSLDEFPSGSGYPNSSRPSWGGLYPQDSHNRGVALICNWSAFCNLHGEWNSNEKNVYINTYELKYTRKSGGSNYDSDNSTNKIKVIGGPSDSSGIVQYNGYLIFYLRGGAKYNFRFDWPNLHPTVNKTTVTLGTNHSYPVISGADSSSLYVPNLDRMWRSQILQEADRISLNVWTGDGVTLPNTSEGAGYTYLRNCGIDIGTRNITLKADKVHFTNTAGTVTDKISIDPTTGTLNAENAHISGDFTFKVTYQDVGDLDSSTTATVSNLHSFYILGGQSFQSYTFTFPAASSCQGLQLQLFNPKSPTRTPSNGTWTLATPSGTKFWLQKSDGLGNHNITSFYAPMCLMTFIASGDYWYELNHIFTDDELAGAVQSQ
jgi:hypothetical protein